MNEFEKACKFSNERWGDSFPDGLEEPDYSAKHKKKMANLIKETEEVKRPRRFTKTARIAVAAAIICVLSVSVFAAASNGQYLVDRFRGYFNYSVEEPYDGNISEGLIVGYLPENFKKADYNLESGKLINYNYESELNPHDFFNITKFTSDISYSFKDDAENIKQFTVNERDYIYYEVAENNEDHRLVWNEGDYVYRIRSNLTMDEMVKIAESAK